MQHGRMVGSGNYLAADRTYSMIPPASSMVRAMFTIIAAMAELESSLISEPVSACMKDAAARGKHLGRPPLAPEPVKNKRHFLYSEYILILKQLQPATFRSERTGRTSRRGRNRPRGCGRWPSGHWVAGSPSGGRKRHGRTGRYT